MQQSRRCEKAIAIDDRFAEAYYLLGLCFRDTQRRDRSLRALETSVRLAPAMVHAREELADLYGRLGRIDDRIAQLETLLALDRGPSRHVALGLAYARAGQFDRAVTTLGQAAERYPDESYAYVALGRVWLEKSAGAPRSRGSEQGDRRAAGSRRYRRQQRGTDAFRPRAAPFAKRGSGRNRAPAGDGKTAGRPARVLLPCRRR